MGSGELKTGNKRLAIGNWQLTIFLFFTAGILNHSFAQADFDLRDELSLDSNSFSKIILHSGYFFSSNAATNQIARTYALNGFITDKMKDDVSKNLDAK